MNVRTFKSKIVDIVWDAVKAHSNVSHHVNTFMMSKYNGFYFKFHRFGQDLFIHILPHADIHIIIKEESYDEQTSIYYTFQSGDEHEGLLPVIREDLDLLIGDFYQGISYSTLAQLHLKFTLTNKEGDWREMYSNIRS